MFKGAFFFTLVAASIRLLMARALALSAHFQLLANSACFLLLPCSDYSSILMMEVVCFSEMSVKFCQITRSHIPEYDILHNHHPEIQFFQISLLPLLYPEDGSKKFIPNVSTYLLVCTLPL
jgi:hypothetical protein